MKKVNILICIMFLLITNTLLSGVKSVKTPSIRINVAYLEDKRLPTISNNDLKEIISAAQNELRLKFGIDNILFKFRRKVNINSFFRKYLKKRSKYYKNLSKHKLVLFQDKINYKPYLPEIIHFLKKNWKLLDLKEFVPNDYRAKIKTYEDFTKYLFKEYLQKIKKLENLKLKSGKFVISRKNNDINSYINWLTVMYFQDKYDIVFSNTLIVYDDITAPYPHAVLRYAKVGGSSFESPKRSLFDGTSAMVNLFEMLTPLKYFNSRYAEKNISKKLWNKIIGAFIMAHEMGHMIYLIPDVYDHPKGCLMDSSNESIDYYKGYQILMKYPQQCPKCKVWVDARNKHFAGDALFKEKKYNEAAYQYKLAAKMTPKKLDIDYNEYISLIYYKMATCYYKMKDYNRTEFYLNKSLKLNPENLKSNKLLKEINEKK